MSKRESTFLTHLRDSFHYHGAFFYKIPDMPHFAGMQTRFDSKKPFDVISAFRHHPIAIEAKVLRKYEAFGIRHLRDCQVDGLEDFLENGLSFVFLKIGQAPNKLEGIERLNRLLIFDWPWFRDKGVLKKDELEKWPFIDYHLGRYEIRDWLYSVGEL